MPLSRYDEMLEQLRLKLSKIEPESQYDYNFLRRLLAEKKRTGEVRLTGTSAHRIWVLWQQYVKHDPQRQEEAAQNG